MTPLRQFLRAAALLATVPLASPLRIAARRSRLVCSVSRRDALADSVRAAAGAGALLSGAGATIAGGSAPALAAGAPPALAVPTTKLGGLEVSQSIAGFWQLSGAHGAYTEQDALRNMKSHFDAGIYTFDTADIYGPSEGIVGKFVRQEQRAVPCTKFCCFRGLETIDRREVRARVENQCRKLGVQKLPLTAFFWSDYSVKRYVDVALMLTELKEEGLIEEIGLTNFDLKRVKEFVDAGVPVVSNQVQLSAMDQRPLRSGMADYCADNGIKLIAFGTVGAGILSERYLGKPPPLAPDNASLRMYSGTANRFGSWTLVQELLATLNEIARRKGVAIASVAQRYVLQKRGVGCVLIGVRNANHIAENVNTFTFALEDGEMAAIDAVVKKSKGPRGDVWDLERGYI